MNNPTRIIAFGTFDGFHKGHENLFRQARKLAKNPLLIVSVARDSNVARIKNRLPRQNEQQRLMILKKHPLVDKAILGGRDNYLPHIIKEKPDIIALGYDQTAYVASLKKDLARSGLHPRVIRLKPFKPHLYKSSLMPKTGKSIKLAIFDIDGTLFRSSLVRELIGQLVDDKVFPQTARQQIEKDYRAWLDRHGSYEAYLWKFIEVYYKTVTGKRQRDIEHAATALLKSKRNQVYRFTRQLMRRTKRRGYFLVAISGSPMDIVAPFAKYFGFDAAYGRIYEVKGGRYTGRVLNDAIMNEQKDSIVKEFIQQSGLKVDLKKSLAVGDTETEIPVLNMVGQPIVFNPNQKLANYAQKKRWPIIVERKDVVYHLHKYKFWKI
jgi:FAD synthetase